MYPTRRLLGLLAAGTLPFALLASLPAASATQTDNSPTARAQQECRGWQATITGKSDGSQRILKGTEGRDVIVSNGVRRIESKGGNDVVCVTGDPKTMNPPTVRAGGGNDIIDARSSQRGVVVYPGRGADRFVGSRFADEVLDGDEPDAARDIIVTRGGDDLVTVGSASEPVRDGIQLGTGSDTARLTNIAGRASINGGSGYNELIAFTQATGFVVWDNRKSELRVGGARRATWGGFTRFRLGAFHAASVKFLGSGEKEALRLYGPRKEALLGGGDDVVEETYPSTNSGGFQRLVGGKGTDTLEFFELASVNANLAEGTFEYVMTADGVETAFPFIGFESLDIYSDAATLIGTADRNEFRALGCDVRMYGAGGNDRLNVTNRSNYDVANFTCPEFTERSTVEGGGGADVLIGYLGTDTLLGGPGHDSADGGEGFDTCRAERRANCEAY